jgi:hypothetical protein
VAGATVRWTGSRATRPWIDQLGGIASAACTAHCLTLALAPALLPLVGLGFLVDEAFEWGFVALAAGAATVAAWLGHAVHRTGWITAGFALGIGAVIGSRLAEVLELPGGVGLAALGGGALVASHVANLRRCRSCGDSSCAVP